MLILSDILVALVALLHIWFLVLEMFLWTKPLGMQAFRQSPEQAQLTRVLAANQGLYNGFLAAGLIYSLILPFGDSLRFRIFFLCCVVVAGIFGAMTVSKRIFFIQALPALLALFPLGLIFLAITP